MSSLKSRTLSFPFFALVLFAGLAVLLASVSRTRRGASSLTAANARAASSDFSVQTLDGSAWHLGDHQGRVVLINYFATWCPPCRAEMPGLVKLAEAYAPKGVDTLALSLDQGGPEVVKPFVQRMKMSFPVAVPDASSSVTAGISSIPVTVLLDRKGRTARTYVGMISEDAVRADLDALLAEQP